MKDLHCNREYGQRERDEEPVEIQAHPWLPFICVEIFEIFRSDEHRVVHRLHKGSQDRVAIQPTIPADYSERYRMRVEVRLNRYGCFKRPTSKRIVPGCDP